MDFLESTIPTIKVIKASIEIPGIKFTTTGLIDKIIDFYFIGKKTSAIIHLALPPPQVSIVSKEL